jgi:hypothetical protein
MHKKLAQLVVISFFSPILALAASLNSHSRKLKQGILIIFVTIFGSVITISEGNDGFRFHMNVYNHYLDLSFTRFIEELYLMLIFQPAPGTKGDVYIHVLSYFVGGILGLPGIFFVVVAFVYGYFFSKSMLHIFKYVQFPLHYKYLFYYFAVFFIFWKGLEGFQTVRTWTGLWVLVYGCLRYFEARKLKYVFLILSPPLFHLGYFAMALPAWGVLVMGIRPKLYALIFFASFVFSANTLVFQTIQSTGQYGNDKVSSYFIEDVDQYRQDFLNTDKTWYLRFQQYRLQDFGLWVLISMLVVTGIYGKGMTKLENSMLSVGMLTFALSNFTSNISALSNRSAIVAGAFILIVLVLLLGRNFMLHLKAGQLTIIKTTLFISGLLLIPFYIYKLADIIYYLSIFMFFFPFVPWFDDEINLSIREFIGVLLGR